jgi:hypothetical protein
LRDDRARGRLFQLKKRHKKLLINNFSFIYRFGLGASAFFSFFLDGDGSARIAACAALYKASN